jgi:hypothetical protein
METIQFIKKLNNTELGKTGIHETYVLIPQSVDLTDVFDSGNLNPRIKDLKSGEIISNIRFTSGRENRIVGLGNYYRDNSISAGDEIVFQKRIINNETIFELNSKINSDLILFQKKNKGFEVLNIDRLNNYLNQGKCSFSIEINNIQSDLKIEFLGSFKKRDDSPIQTDFYSLSINDANIASQYSNNEIIELKIGTGNKPNTLSKSITWKKLTFKTI